VITFSQHERRLPAGGCDVIVIGGGIVGVALARLCARAGNRVVLLEKCDFGSGTTSRSTRIIHGGLRYLEHAELSLVRESLRERERLLRERSHLVKPLNFILAVGQSNRLSRLEIRAGLWLYRRLARSRLPARDDPQALRQLENALDSAQQWALFEYEDAQCEYPERLLAEWLMEATAAGAVPLNYCEALEVTVSHSRARGVIVRDRITGREELLEGQFIFNCTGPWADKICQASGVDTAGSMVGGVRGTHLVLPHFAGAPSSAIYTQADDGRKIFIIPWDRQILLGTTEVRQDEDPDRVKPSAEEISYLLRGINSIFPDARLALGDVRYAYAGVRALPSAAADSALSAVTRRHILRDHAADGAQGLFSLIGGKLTTAAAIARHCARAIGIHASEPALGLVALGDADGVNSTLRQWSRMAAEMTGISEATARSLAAWHGRRAFCVAQLARKDALLRQPLCDHSRHIVAEAVDAVQHQHAATLADVLLRRVPVAFAASCNAECGRQAAERIGKVLRWDSSAVALQYEQFEMERSAFLVRPELPTRQAEPRPWPALGVPRERAS
jgi:glycerol-3-phosphate dehydrogenase